MLEMSLPLYHSEQTNFGNLHHRLDRYCYIDLKKPIELWVSIKYSFGFSHW